MEKSTNLICRKILDHSLLIPMKKIEGGDFYQLNSSASFLWDRMEEFENLDQIAEALVSEYDISIELALSGAKDFLESLKEFEVLS